MKRIGWIIAMLLIIGGIAGGCGTKKVEEGNPGAGNVTSDNTGSRTEDTAVTDAAVGAEDNNATGVDEVSGPQNGESGMIIVGTDVATIAEALGKASEGDTVFIPKGIYHETVSVEKNGVTLKGEDGSVIDGGELKLNDDNSTGICVNGKDITVEDIEVRNFLIEGPSDICPVGIKVAKGSSGIVIRGCKVHDLGFVYDYSSDDDNYNAHGIYVSGGVNRQTSDILVEGCELYNLHLGSSESLVFNGNVVNFEAKGNYIHHCDNIGIDAIGYEQDEDNENDSARNGKIHENIVTDICSDPAVNPTYDSMCADGIYVDGGRDIEIFDNFVIRCDIGIEVASEHQGKVTSGINVHDNVLAFNNSWAGICIGGYDPEETGTAKNCVIKGNTVYNTSNYCLVVQYACDESNVIEDNLFVAEKEGIAYGDEFDELSRGNTIRNNCFTIDMSEFGYPENEYITVKSVTVDEKAGTVTIEQ